MPDVDAAPVAPAPDQASQAPLPMPAAPAPQPQPMAAPNPPVPGKQSSWLSTLSHAFAGAVLGTVANREKEIAPPSVDTNGTMQGPTMGRATTGDMLRTMARGALTGLAAGSQVSPQKSGSAQALAGLGAGFSGEENQIQAKQQLERKQASEDFERQQQVILNRAQNAHTIIETMKTAREMQNQDLDSGLKFASLGQDQLDAAVAGGNQIAAENIPASDLGKFRDEHPEYLNYTPILTKVAPREGAKPDPETGEIPNDRFYSFVDMSKPTEITQPMITHLKAVGFPGADSLQAGQKVPAQQFQGLWYQGLKMYNQALLNPANKELKDVTLPNGNPGVAVYNKTLDTTEILRDPETQKPLGGKVETEQARIMGSDGKTHDIIVNSKNGKPIKDLGLAGTAADNEGLRTFGDYSRTGDAYLATVEQPIQNDVRMLGNYNMDPAALGRGGANRAGIISAVGQYRPNWNENLYKERYDYVKGYQNSSTGDGASRSRINTALGHLNMLDQARQGIGQNDLRALNQLANEYGFQTGQPAPVLYNLIAEKAATEAAAATGSNTKEEIEAQRRNLQLNASPSQQHAQIEGNIKLLKTQAETIENNFKQAMGDSADELGRPVIYPQNKAIIDKWTAPSSQNGQGYAATATGPGGHKIGTNDGGKTWVDVTTGQPIGAK